MTELSVIKNTTNTWTITFTNNGGVQDITGWTVFFTVKKNYSNTDTQAVISKTISIHTNPTQGITQLVLTPTDTNISAGTYLYDIGFIDNSNNRSFSSPDNFTILNNVTQRSS
jgi:hypothetical protein